MDEKYVRLQDSNGQNVFITQEVFTQAVLSQLHSIAGLYIGTILEMRSFFMARGLPISSLTVEGIKEISK